MNKQLELTEDEKRRMLKAHFPDLSMLGKRECLHCGSVITVGDFRVFKEDGFLTITCPTDNCDGTPLDWMPLTE